MSLVIGIIDAIRCMTEKVALHGGYRSVPMTLEYVIKGREHWAVPPYFRSLVYNWLSVLN